MSRASLSRVASSASGVAASSSSSARARAKKSTPVRASSKRDQKASHAFVVEPFHLIVGARRARRALGHRDFAEMQRVDRDGFGGGGADAIRSALERERAAKRAIERELADAEASYASDAEIRALKTKKLRLKDATTALERDLARAESARALGEGGNGKVWRARDADTGEPVAIKVEDARGTTEEESALAREYELTRAVAASDVRFFPSVHYFGRQNVMGKPSRVMVLDLLSGGSLEDLSQRVSLGTGFSRCTTARVAERLFSALEATCGARIVHGDIKPDNLLLSKPQGGDIKLVDFGEAVRFDDEYVAQIDETVPEDQWRGTLLFSSVHVDSGSKASFRDDLESAVYTLAFLRTGRLPWTRAIDVEDGDINVRELAETKRTVDSGAALLTPSGATALPNEYADDVEFFDKILRIARSLRIRERPNFETIRALAADYRARRDDPYDWDLTD